MRILFLATWFPYPHDNGSKIRTYYLLRSLAERHEVTLLSFAFDMASWQSPGPLADLCKRIAVVCRDPFQRSVAERRLRFLSLAPLSTRPDPEMARLVRDALARECFDAVIASTHVMAAYASLAPRSTVHVLEEHNSLSRWLGERYRAAHGPSGRMRCWLSWQKVRAYERRSVARFDLCTMVSEQDRAVTLKLRRGRSPDVQVIPNGVDCEYNRPNNRLPRAGSLVFNGSLGYHANYEAVAYFLQQVYPIIRQHVPGATLTVTGSTAGVDLGGLALAEGVSLSGYVPDVRPLVSGSQACVVPLRSGGGTRLKILEAMALGTPVVATTKGAEGLEVVDGEHILLADDPGSFAQRTLDLMHDADLRARVAARARRLVEEKYDWQQLGRGFSELVQAAAAQRRMEN